MKLIALLLASALAATGLYSATPLQGSFLLSSESVTSPDKHVTVSRGRASFIGKSFRVSADEIILDQTFLGHSRRSIIVCRGVTAVSSGMAIPASKELTFEIDSQANIYRLNTAGITMSAPAGPK